MEKKYEILLFRKGVGTKFHVHKISFIYIYAQFKNECFGQNPNHNKNMYIKFI